MYKYIQNIYLYINIYIYRKIAWFHPACQERSRRQASLGQHCQGTRVDRHGQTNSQGTSCTRTIQTYGHGADTNWTTCFCMCIEIAVGAIRVHQVTVASGLKHGGRHCLGRMNFVDFLMMFASPIPATDIIDADICRYLKWALKAARSLAGVQLCPYLLLDATLRHEERPSAPSIFGGESIYETIRQVWIKFGSCWM